MQNLIKIGFLGGVTEFGKNCSFVEYDNDIIIIDCGFKFYNKNELGIRYEIPDFNYLIKNQKKIKGIIITHGHLDHIGSIPFLLEEIKCDIFCTPFTKHLISKQLQNNKKYTNYIKIIDYNIFSLGNFKIEPFSVTHSVIDSVGFIVHTPIEDNTKLIFCGDLNFDERPYLGKLTHFNLIKKYKNDPKVLFLDSTNAVSQGSNISETEVYENLEKIFIDNIRNKRIFLTTFSSQIQRQIAAFDLAIKYKRKILVIGRSIFENFKYLFTLSEYKKYQDLVVFSEEQYKSDENYLIICTGSQGEENSAIEKIIQKRIKKISVQKEDLFIFSSSIIPGNEKYIFEIWNQIYFQGGKILSYKDKNIHSSGHGKIDEIKKILDIIKPDYLIPVHGEYRNLYKLKEVAQKQNIDLERIFIFNLGDVFEINSNISPNKRIHFKYNLNLQNIIIDNYDYLIDKKTINERKKIAENGILIISLPKQKNQKSFDEIKIKGIGIANFYSNEENALKEEIYNHLDNSNFDAVSQLVKKFFKEKNLSKPTIYLI